MSLHDAVVNAAQSVLNEYLAPDLAQQLTQEIMQRARFDMEAALSTFVGFEVGKAAPARQAAPAGKRGRRKKDEPPEVLEPEPVQAAS